MNIFTNKNISTAHPHGGGMGVAFIRKEFKHISRDSRTMLILLVMPIVLICLFGFAISMEVRGTRVAILDEKQTPQTQRLCHEIDANRYFSVVSYLHGNEHLDDLLQQGRADVVVIISRNQGIQILADGAEPNQAQTRASYLVQIISASQSSHAVTAINTTSPQGMMGGASVRMLFNPQLKSAYNFVPGVIGMILLLICAMMTSISIVREKEMGTMEILLASPLPPIYIIIAKLLPYLAVSSVNLVTILLLSYFVLGVPIAGSILLFCLVTLVYIFVALALGLLISNAVNSQLAALLISLLLIVPSIYLSNMVFPLESMPVPAQVASNIVPTRWYIDAARKILIQGVSFKYVAKDLAVLIVEAVLFIGISVKLFKTRLQ